MNTLNRSPSRCAAAGPQAPAQAANAQQEGDLVELRRVARHAVAEVDRPGQRGRQAVACGRRARSGSSRRGRSRCPTRAESRRGRRSSASRRGGASPTRRRRGRRAAPPTMLLPPIRNARSLRWASSQGRLSQPGEQLRPERGADGRAHHPGDADTLGNGVSPTTGPQGEEETEANGVRQGLQDDVDMKPQESQGGGNVICDGSAAQPA